MDYNTDSRSGLSDSIRRIEERLDKLGSKEEEQKEWKLPFFKSKLSKKKKKMGWCVVIYINANGSIKFVKSQIDENVVAVDGMPHKVDPKDILIYKNKLPIIIIPAWSERAFSPRAHYKGVEERNEGSEGYRFIMNYILKSQIKEKKPMGSIALIIGIIAVIGLGYYLIKNGAFS